MKDTDLSAKILLSALEEYFCLKNDLTAGIEIDEGEMVAVKKRFAQALNEYIDWRAEGVLEARKRRISTERSIQLADIFSSLPPPPKIPKDLISTATIAINSAPTPPQDLDELIQSGKIRDWVENYKKWYKEAKKK